MCHGTGLLSQHPYYTGPMSIEIEKTGLSPEQQIEVARALGLLLGSDYRIKVWHLDEDKGLDELVYEDNE